jgi:polysaccharide export outer membrane protein
MMRSRSVLLGLLAVLALPVAVSAQAGTGAQAFGQQTLKPGDVVRLGVWREPDFSGEFVVNEGGFVTLPRLGEVRVVDFTSIELQAELLSRYQQFLRNPSITIVVLKRIRILGAVRNPGLYPVDATISIADALALAGGVTPDGSQDKVELRRAGETVVAELDVNALLAGTPLRSGDQLYVPQRSWISRNTNILAATIGAVATVVLALTR